MRRLRPRPLCGRERLWQPIGMAAGGGERVAGPDVVAFPQLRQREAGIEGRLARRTADGEPAGSVTVVAGDMRHFGRAALLHSALLHYLVPLHRRNATMERPR